MRTIIAFCLLLTIVGCLEFFVPDDFYIIPTQLKDIPADPMNPLTPEKVKAGEYFFFSKAISEDGRVSCESCHSPERGFTSPSEKFIGGCGQGCILSDSLYLDPHYVGKVDTMNFVKSYGASGAAYMKVMGRSGRFGMIGENKDCQQDILKHFGLISFPPCEATLFQAFVALRGHRQLLKKRLIDDIEGVAQLQIAFPDSHIEEISEDSVAFLIAMTLDAFQRVEGLKHAQGSKFNGVMSGIETFNWREKKGYDLLKTNCISCHKNEVFGGGLEESFIKPNRFVVDHRAELTGIGILDTNKVYRVVPPLRNNLKSHFRFGSDGSYKTPRSYLIDKLVSLDLDTTDVDFYVEILEAM